MEGKNSNMAPKIDYRRGYGGKAKKKLMLKTCCYPECDVEFMGVGKAKYCEEHRKPVYRKVLDADRIQAKKDYIKNNNFNQVIDHKLSKCELVIHRCQLEGCPNEFKLLLIPNINTYPKFCEEHRSEHRRKLFVGKKK